MIISKHYSLEASDSVLNVVSVLLRDFKSQDKTQRVSISSWSNGREQGYHLVRHTSNLLISKYIVFAQQRNSDEIVVLADNKPFHPTTNMPSEFQWEKNVRYFHTHKQAAEYIVKELTSI